VYFFVYFKGQILEEETVFYISIAAGVLEVGSRFYENLLVHMHILY